MGDECTMPSVHRRRPSLAEREVRRERQTSSCIRLALVGAVLSAFGGIATAAPYETVAIYAKTTSSQTRKEITIEDVAQSSDDNVVLPAEFTDADGSAYRLNSIEERLDVTGVDKQFFRPYLDVSVTAKANGQVVRNPELLNTDKSIASWTLTELNAWSSNQNPVVTVSIDIKASYSTEYLCGLEEIYREANGKPLSAGYTHDGFAGKIYRDSTLIPTKFIEDKAGRPILFSFCDLKAHNDIDSVRWESVLTEVAAHPDLALNSGSTDSAQLREAHKNALIHLLLGNPLPNDVELTRVAAAGKPTNLVIHDHVNFSIANVATLPLMESSSNEVRPVANNIDQGSALRLDLSPYGPACGSLLSSPYSIAVIGTDEKDNPVVMKAPLTGAACAPTLNFKWSDYLGKKLTVEWSYELPGEGGTVLIARSNEFTVRQFGIISTIPVYTEIASAIKAKSANDLTLTSSIPISWAVRISKPTSASFSAVTFPWKLSYNPRCAPDLAKYVAIYPHITVIFPTDNSAGTSTTYALGVGVSLAQVFNFAYGYSPPNQASFLFIGLSVPDLLKALK